MKTIQIRDVPDDLHRDLRLRAAERDLSLSEYLRRELLELARLPSIADVLGEGRARTPGVTSRDVLDALHEGRQEREARLDAVTERRHRT